MNVLIFVLVLSLFSTSFTKALMLDESQSWGIQEILSSTSNLEYKRNNPIIGYIHVAEKANGRVY